SVKGIEWHRAKVQALLDKPAPTDKKSLQKYIGILNWFGKFLYHITPITAPLLKLFKTGQDWVWGEEQQLAFEQIQLMLASEPVLSPPDGTKRFYVQTDASKYGTGAVLYQLEGEGEVDAEGNPVKSKDLKKRIIAYASHKFTDAESR